MIRVERILPLVCSAYLTQASWRTKWTSCNGAAGKKSVAETYLNKLRLVSRRIDSPFDKIICYRLFACVCIKCVPHKVLSRESSSREFPNCGALYLQWVWCSFDSRFAHEVSTLIALPDMSVPSSDTVTMSSHNRQQKIVGEQIKKKLSSRLNVCCFGYQFNLRPKCRNAE